MWEAILDKETFCLPIICLTLISVINKVDINRLFLVHFPKTRSRALPVVNTYTIAILSQKILTHLSDQSETKFYKQ